MKVPGLNLGEWLERLGVRRPGWAPEVSEHIQPVVVVRDDSRLVNRVAVAEGHIQAFRPLALLLPNRADGCQIDCRAPGGARVYLTVSTEQNQAASAYVQYQFRDTDVNAEANIDPALTVTQTAQLPDPRRPIRSVVTSHVTDGGLRVLALDAFPILLGGAQVFNAAPDLTIMATPHPRLLDVFLPPGRKLYLEAYTNAAVHVYNIVIQEFEASEVE